MPDYSQLMLLSKLQDNWDGDDAPAPAKEALQRTRTFLDGLKRQPDDIDADALGGVALWFYFDDHEIMIGIYNEAKSVLCFYEHKGPLSKVNSFADDSKMLMYINCISMLQTPIISK
jgi:hypothetical protein